MGATTTCSTIGELRVFRGRISVANTFKVHFLSAMLLFDSSDGFKLIVWRVHWSADEAPTGTGRLGATQTAS